MNKKSILTLCCAILIPVACYLALKFFGEGTVVVPRKILIDDVVQIEKKGKKVNDTIWHKTRNFKLVNQLGDTVSLYDIKNKPIVIDVFFSHCAGICPRLTKSMKKLQTSFKTGGSSRLKMDTGVVHFLSFSIDPENDSVARLREYADYYGINPDNWWLLTGNKDSIYNFIFEELKLDKVVQDTIDKDFPHTSHFVLLDKNYHVRWRLGQAYNGLDSSSMKMLARDIGLLMLEKDKKKPSTLFAKIIDLSWLWLIIAVCVTGFVWILKRNRN
jgi:protein SCO1